MMAESDRLRRLQMGETGHDGRCVCLGQIEYFVQQDLFGREQFVYLCA